jgi:hypothetical protein
MYKAIRCGCGDFSIYINIRLNIASIDFIHKIINKV